MKGKTKGERKNKSIKKNQIPAFMLTGGEIKDYSEFVNNDNQNYKEAMVHAAEEVKNKLKICNENAIRLQQLKEQETSNMTKLADLVQTLQTSQVENKSKIYECNTIKETLEKANAELTRLQNIEKENTSKITEINENAEIIDDLKKQLEEAKEKDETQARKNLAANLVGENMRDAVTNTANKEIDSKIQTLTEEKEHLASEIEQLQQKNEELQKEKDIVNEGIKQKETDLTKIKKDLEASNAKNTELAGVISAHYDNLKKILQDQTTIVKEDGDGEGTRENIDGPSIEDLANSGNKLQELSGQIENLMATNKEHSEANKTVHLENEQLKLANAQLKVKNEQIAKGTHESLSGITNKIAEQTQLLEGLIDKKTNAEGIIKQGKLAQETVEEAQTNLNNIKKEAAAAQKTITDAKQAQAEADAAKAEADAEKLEVGQANEKCEENLEKANKALEAANKEKEECQEALAAAKTEADAALAAAKSEAEALEQAKTENETLTQSNETLTQSNETLTGDKANLQNSYNTTKNSLDQATAKLNNSISKEDCDERIADARKATVAGEQKAAQDMESDYEGSIETIEVDKIDKNTYDSLDEDVKTIITKSVSSVDNPQDNPNVSDMDYVYTRDANNISAFTDNNINNPRKDYRLRTHVINNGMLFLFVHDKRESTSTVIDDNNRQIYICKIDSIDNTNITADCWNISTSMNDLLHNYKQNEHSPNYHESKVTINPDDSKTIHFSTIPHHPRGKRNKQSNINKELPKIYKELLTEIIHTGVNKDKGITQNQNIYRGNHANNKNIEGIKNQNIIPVYPYGQDSYNLLRRRVGDPSFQKSKNYIIYLTDYERIIKNEDKNKYFPVKNNNDKIFTMFLKNSVEIRYLHALIENAKKGFLKEGDQKTLNIGAKNDYQEQPKEQKKLIASQETTRRLIGNLNPMPRKGGKKNLTKYKGMLNSKKGGYRYSALGMKGLTIDLSGLKAKKTRRIKKKGKTVKNKNGSRKSKKGSRKDKTKKNKRRGRTYRNKK